MHVPAGGRAEKGGRERENVPSRLPAELRTLQGARSQTLRSQPELKPTVGHFTDCATQVPLELSLSNKKVYIKYMRQSRSRTNVTHVLSPGSDIRV